MAPRHSRGQGINACRLETDRLAPSKNVKSGHSWPARKTPSEKRFAGGPIVARDLVLAVCRLALYNTCSSDIHVVKEIFIILKEIAKYADTCTAAQVDLSLSVGLWVAGTFKL